MKRRKFLLWTGIGVGAIILPSSLYVVSGSIKKYAVLLIERQLDYLKLEPGSVAKYVDDYFKDDNQTAARLKWKTIYYLHIHWERSDQLKELIKYYLLSSDFFINKMDESKTVRYLGLYSPYKSPLPNPFSYILYPPDTIKNA
jgi:hypothetical protein